ncbi:MAG: hypothetical protein U0136_16790 [Bdellovibrionota bacterium]
MVIDLRLIEDDDFGAQLISALGPAIEYQYLVTEATGKKCDLGRILARGWAKFGNGMHTVLEAWQRLAEVSLPLPANGSAEALREWAAAATKGKHADCYSVNETGNPCLAWRSRRGDKWVAEFTWDSFGDPRIRVTWRSHSGQPDRKLGVEALLLSEYCTDYGAE